jgi:hypothetical protein
MKDENKQRFNLRMKFAWRSHEVSLKLKPFTDLLLPDARFTFRALP